MGTIKLAKDANAPVKGLHDNAELGLRIFKHAPDYQLYQWHDAAWACRPDGLSQGGYMTCAGDSDAADGALGQFNIIDWTCKKLPRVARS